MTPRGPTRAGRAARAAVAAVALVVAAVGCTSEASSSAGRATSQAGIRLRQARTFALALGLQRLSPAQLDRLGRYELVVLDSTAATTATVADLHRHGAVVLTRLSIGTIEANRPWSASLDRYRLEASGGSGEHDAQVSAPGYRRAITTTVAPLLLRTGVDGLFVDHTDVVATHPRERAGMKLLVGQLADLLHGRGQLLVAQDGDRTIDDILARLDGWNRQGVSSTYDPATGRYRATSTAERARAVATIERIKAQDVVVTTTDLVADGDRAGTDGAEARSCDAGAVPFVSNAALDRIADPPLRC